MAPTLASSLASFLASSLALCAFGAVLGGTGRRIAGGVIPQWFGWSAPGLLCKWTFGLNLALACWLAGGPLWFCGVTFLGTWLGHITGLHKAAGMGRFGPDNRLFTTDRFWRDFWALSLYGLAVVLIPGVAACYFVSGTESLWLLLAGLMVSPVYALAWRVWPSLPWWRGISGNPLEIGEWAWGAILGVGTVLDAGVG